MAKRLTLSQFERLDGALDACLRASEGREEVRAESRLYDTIIDLIGYDRASSIPCLREWAAERVTSFLVAA